MKKAVKTEKRFEGKKAVKTHEAKSAKPEKTQTLAETMEEIIFQGATDPELRIEQLEVWRGRNPETRERLFQADLERMAVAALTEQDHISVMVSVTLEPSQWQKLIALGAADTREHFKGSEFKMPEWAGNGPLGDIVSTVLHKSLTKATA